MIILEKETYDTSGKVFDYMMYQEIISENSAERIYVYI